MTSSTYPFSAVFGTGRSGTSWLGSIIDSHPRVAYRFEPFHRGKTIPVIKRARNILAKETLDASGLETIRDSLLEPYPVMERPPFFAKDHSRMLGKSAFYKIARVVSPLGWVYRKAFGPSEEAQLVFKEVALEHEFRRLATETETRLVYVVRHPCGYVASMLKGIAKGVMPSGRANVAEDLARDRSPKLYASLKGRSENLSLVERLAIVWRADTDFALAAVAGRENVIVINYDEFCERPKPLTEKMFSHLNLEMTNATRAFLQQSTSGVASRSETRNRYFSVFRDPMVSANKWRQTLKSDEINSIQSIVEGALAFEWCADHWTWSPAG